MNGYTRSCSGTDPVGSTVQYRCLSGYDLVGDADSICLSNGNWSGIKPTCQRGECTPVVIC